MCGAGAFARAKWGESLLIVARKIRVQPEIGLAPEGV